MRTRWRRRDRRLASEDEARVAGSIPYPGIKKLKNEWPVKTCSRAETQTSCTISFRISVVNFIQSISYTPVWGVCKRAPNWVACQPGHPGQQKVYDGGVVRIFCLLALAFSVSAADDPPTSLSAILLPMREHPAGPMESRGATPQLTAAKHQLRDWIEENLAGLGEHDDPSALFRSLNSALSNQKLFCSFFDSASEDPPCPDQILLGYLEAVRASRESDHIVIVQTGVGIQCGFDESAYLYEWAEGHWQRRWENEQDDYAEKQYKPQRLEAVHISRPDDQGSLNVLTLGRQPWCASNWHDVYYRLWRIGARDQAPKLLFEGSEDAFVLNGIHGTVDRDDALIEYTVISLDKGVLLRQTVQHFHIDGDRVERIAPLALSPRDFVDEWLNRPWSVSVAWSEAAARTMLQPWHRRLHSDSPNGEFAEDTLHCPGTPDRWQVGITLDGQSEKYFLVRWRPPYRFSMAGVSSQPYPGCTEKDPEADAPRTLFLGQ